MLFHVQLWMRLSITVNKGMNMGCHERRFCKAQAAGVTWLSGAAFQRQPRCSDGHLVTGRIRATEASFLSRCALLLRRPWCPRARPSCGRPERVRARGALHAAQAAASRCRLSLLSLSLASFYLENPGMGPRFPGRKPAAPGGAEMMAFGSFQYMF